MTMPFALQFVEEWYQDKYGWKPSQCRVYPEAKPPLDCMESWFIGIDDIGIESGPDTTDSLKEICSIQIGVWRRYEHLIKNLSGIIKLPTDKYLLGAFTLYEMERKVLVCRSEGEPLYGLHQNWNIVSGINSRYNLPHDILGDGFKYPFAYRGRGQMEEIGYPDDRGNVRVWAGYRLRFRGLAREQKLRGSNVAIG